MAKTYLSRILEALPNFDTDILLDCCPYHIFGGNAHHTTDEDCDFDCDKCWNREYKEEAE